MNYIEYIFRTEPSDPGLEIVEAALSELAFESFVIEDDTLKAYVKEEEYDQREFDDMFIWSLDTIKISYQKNIVPQQNWNAIWESSFSPIDVEGKAVVRAPFHHPPKSGLDIVIEPRMSFGTGHHQTTYMMMSLLLETDCDNKTVCDMGCGTGVLAIIAKKRGAARTLAVDIDQWAYDNTVDNLQVNNCTDIEVRLGGAEALADEKFDVFIANINRNILISYMSEYAKAVNDGGELLLSGFFEPDADSLVDEAAKYGFSLQKTVIRDHWAALCLRKTVPSHKV